uniref:Tetrathionate reductase subunit B (Tetrathionate reductase subunit TtrB) n=1 Tax=Ganoderma boninense TaxID=34458 RepID=A0A5K1K6R6_9APHY|nr:Tetrathionate reductase subunit B (Tetrathionate reductase subunit TtrB) [Ganoderma boninense]
MPASPFYHRDHERDAASITLAASDMSLRDHSPMFSFDDHMPQYDPMISDPDNMIFGLELDDALHPEPKSPFTWDSSHLMQYSSMSSIPFPGSPESTTSQLDPMMPSHPRRFDSTFSTSSSFYHPSSPEYNDSALYSNWIADPDAPHSSSVPIPIPPGHAQASQSPLSSSSFAAFSENSSIFPDVTPFSPTTAYAALQPLPLSPPEDTVMTEQLRAEVAGTISPPANLYGTEPPAWASHLWDPAVQMPSAGIPMTVSEDNFATQRPRIPMRRGTPVTQLFQSSSAPSVSHARGSLGQSRLYSTRRSESISEHDDRDATVRGKKRPVEDDETQEQGQTREKRSESPPLKSVLRPPKLAPSAWQLYFTDWIQRHQASSHKKLNVAQAAKEAGQEYARLSAEEKEPYRRRSQALKEARERDLNAYMRTLTPDDIKRENAYRTAQRKAGKSRKGNIKDPNAPKKPLSAYFMFLQRIRSDPELVKEVFGDETETTKQSVLAAGKWRSMTDEERKPFLAQAEQEKLEYEAARKLYEEGTTGYSNSINFSILPGGPINLMPIPRASQRLVKQEALSSESESDGFNTDDGADHALTSQRRP